MLQGNDVTQLASTIDETKRRKKSIMNVTWDNPKAKSIQV